MPRSPPSSDAWPAPRSPTPSWHLSETFLSPPGAPPRQWNPPSTLTLAPGETRQFAVCFTLATAQPATSATQKSTLSSDGRVSERRAAVAGALMGAPGASTSTGRGPRVRDLTLARVGAPVLFPIPGYVIGTDMSNVSLAILPPLGESVASVSCDDPDVLTVVLVAPVLTGGEDAAANLTSVSLQGLSRGTARIVVTYTDETWQVSVIFRLVLGYFEIERVTFIELTTRHAFAVGQLLRATAAAGPHFNVWSPWLDLLNCAMLCHYTSVLTTPLSSYSCKHRMASPRFCRSIRTECKCHALGSRRQLPCSAGTLFERLFLFKWLFALHTSLCSGRPSFCSGVVRRRRWECSARAGVSRSAGPDSASGFPPRRLRILDATWCEE